MIVTPHGIYGDEASMLRPAFRSRPLPLILFGMSLEKSETDGVNIL